MKATHSAASRLYVRIGDHSTDNTLVEPMICSIAAQTVVGPMFIVAIAAVWLIAKVSDKKGPGLPGHSSWFSSCCSPAF
jgi:hypothetical protein